MTDKLLKTRVEFPQPDIFPVIVFCRLQFYHPFGNQLPFHDLIISAHTLLAMVMMFVFEVKEKVIFDEEP